MPRTNKQIIYPRCHLDSQLTLRRLAGYQHIPGNSRIPTRCRILRKNPFPCTLSGPFDNLFLTRFSASRVLCKGIVAVISTSTVYNIQLLRTDFTRKYKSCQAKKSYGNISCIFFDNLLHRRIRFSLEMSIFFKNYICQYQTQRSASSITFFKVSAEA